MKKKIPAEILKMSWSTICYWLATDGRDYASGRTQRRRARKG